MEEIIYIKPIDGIAYQIAHVYEHAFINACHDKLRNDGLLPSLIGDFSGATFYATFMYVCVNVFDSANASLVRNFFTSNLQPSKDVLQSALQETACEDKAVVTIMNKAVYKQKLNKFSKQDWVKITEQTLIEENCTWPSPIVYKEDKSLYKHCRIEIIFESIKPIEAALLSRLAYMVSGALSQTLRRVFQAYTLEEHLLTYTAEKAILAHTLVINATISKAAIESAVRDTLQPFSDTKNVPQIAQHFKKWSTGTESQLGTVAYYRGTGVLVGSQALSKEAATGNFTHIIERATIHVSLRKF
jgi:hypothetical protein